MIVMGSFAVGSGYLVDGLVRAGYKGGLLEQIAQRDSRRQITPER